MHQNFLVTLHPLVREKYEQIIPLTHEKEEVIVRLVEDGDKLLLLLREKAQNQIKTIADSWR